MVDNSSLKLDSADRIILTELDKNCRVSYNVLAKKVRKSRQTVEYRVRQLMEKGVIAGFHAAFNPHKMGYKLYKIYLKLRNVPQEKTRLFSFLRKSGWVYWMGECSGTWDLIFAVFAKNDYEFYELKNEIISTFNEIIIETEGQSLLDVQQYPKMYLTNETQKPILFAGELVNNKLDALDYAILENMVKNGQIPLVELAHKVKSTLAIVQTRLKKLMEKGVIIQFRVGVNLNKLGLELYKAVISLDRYTQEDEKALADYFARLSATQYYIRNLWSIEPELVVKNYQEYYHIIEDLKKKFPYVIKRVDSVLMITDEWAFDFKKIVR